MRVLSPLALKSCGGSQLINMLLRKQTVSANKAGPVKQTASAKKAGPVFKPKSLTQRLKSWNNQ